MTQTSVLKNIIKSLQLRVSRASNLRLALAIFAVLFAGAAYIATVADAESAGGARPVVVEISLENQAITPVTARFIDRALREAESQQAECLVIELDTPGGLVDSTRAIVSQIIAARVPVVVYVAPGGARAASAGLFVTMSAHVAAMAPATNIGAAHPVQIGGLPIGSEPSTPMPVNPTINKPEPGKNEPGGSSPMEEKIVNDTVAWIRSLAQLRGRNADWAALAVTESRSLPAAEAVKEHVVDLMASNLNDLLHQIDGREIALLQGSVRLHTADAQVHTMSMWWGEEVLEILSNPTLAVVLLVLGFYGMLFEFYTPGWGVVGTVGVICFVLGLFGMSVLPLNYAGLALILLALGLFAAEAFVHAYGSLTLGGVICLVLGSMMLVNSPIGFMRVSMSVVGPLAVATGLIVLFLVTNVVRTHRRRVQTGGEDMLRRPAVVDEAFAAVDSHYLGYVRIHGEIWRAESETAVEPGKVEVLDRRGLTLSVRPTIKS